MSIKDTLKNVFGHFPVEGSINDNERHFVDLRFYLILKKWMVEYDRIFHYK